MIATYISDDSYLFCQLWEYQAFSVPGPGKSCEGTEVPSQARFSASQMQMLPNLDQHLWGLKLNSDFEATQSGDTFHLRR